MYILPPPPFIIADSICRSQSHYLHNDIIITITQLYHVVRVLQGLDSKPYLDIYLSVAYAVTLYNMGCVYLRCSVINNHDIP